MWVHTHTMNAINHVCVIETWRMRLLSLYEYTIRKDCNIISTHTCCVLVPVYRIHHTDTSCMYVCSPVVVIGQVRFWKLRQLEWEKYASPRGVIQAQGDLSNAMYFDFISYAQMAAADACLREKKRQNPGDLLDAHFRMTGEIIWKSLREEAAGADVAPRYSIPPPLTTPPHEGAQEILALLVARGFATESKVVVQSAASGGARGRDAFVSTLCGGATSWGTSELLKRGCVCSTAYERVIIAAWLREALAADTNRNDVLSWSPTSFIPLGDSSSFMRGGGGDGGGCVKTVWTPPVVT